MNTIWGLSPDSYNFVADAFWPMVLAQFGIIGLLVFVYIIFKIYMNIQQNSNLYKYLSQMTILIYLLSSSMGEVSFTGPQALVSFLIIGFMQEKRRTYR